MLIQHDPDEYETVSSSHTCPYHLTNPGKPYAGCTCSGSIESRRRSPEEIAKIKADKRAAHEAEILAEAAAIQGRRSLVK